MTDADVTVLERDPYAPRVVRRGDQLVLQVYVASGHMDREVELVVDERHVAVLRDDVQRYHFLFAALHHPYQLRETEPTAAELDRYFDTILFGSRADVEAFLTRLDHGTANGALSNLVTIFTGARYERMRAGHWFDA